MWGSDDPPRRLFAGHHGRPMWGSDDPPRRLFAGQHGGWMIGDAADAHERNVGWLKAEGDVLPHLLPEGAWERYDAGWEEWMAAPGTAVTAEQPPSGAPPPRPGQPQLQRGTSMARYNIRDSLACAAQPGAVARCGSPGSPARESHAPWALLRRRLEFCLREGDADGAADA
eukprot:gene47856-4889_t